MGKITDYKIVTESLVGCKELTAQDGLAKKVKELLEQGWEPLSGVSTYGNPIKLSQAMVRRSLT